MKFPYGISDFYQLITEAYFYVDRTDRIRAIEDAGKQLLFLRPRRFGKSLWLSTLENYYDVAKAADFPRLFGQLAIGQDPTPLHNQYFILKWDFSVVDPQGSAATIKRALHDHLNRRIDIFANRYTGMFSQPISVNENNAISSFESVLAAIQRTPYKLYLLIDEYDNFANEVLTASRDRYETLLFGEGLLKTVFKAIKSASSGLGLDRVFITGVSPVVMSDITSGYNIVKNIYLRPDFNDLCGFTAAEVTATLQQTAAKCALSEEQMAEARALVERFYNGYSFSEDAADLVYNPTLVLYFLETLQRACRYPRQMLDSNLAMDRAKIAYIARLPNGAELIVDILNEETMLSVPALATRFGVQDILTTTQDTTWLASLLYYFGVLTIGERTSHAKLRLQIPNLVTRRLYAEQIRDMLLPSPAHDAALRAAEALYSAGEMQPLCEFIEQRYFAVLDNRDYRWANELTIKTAFLTLLFNDLLYIMDSEPALAREYADLVMIVRPDMRQYQLLDVLIEFKYLKLQDDLAMSGAAVREMERTALIELSKVQEKLAEARAKLQEYRQTLNAKYGAALHLRTYAVVALGFDRLVWEEVDSEA